MNEYYYTYSKLRQEFGRHCSFSLTEPRILGVIDPNPEQMDQLIPQNPRNFCGDTLIELSEHTVNTGNVSVCGRGMRHVEGGWPKEVDPTDPQEVAKWKKRAERDPAFLQSVKQLTAECSRVLQQNLVVDLFEDYFKGSETSRGSEQRLYAKSIALLKDSLGQGQRSVTCIAWHPEGPQKLAVGYGVMEFPGQPESLPTSALLWDPSHPNNPVAELGTSSPVVSLAFNSKISDMLIGGCYNGVVCLWDLRKGMKPVEVSSSGSSHYDPVYEVVWTQSKTNSEFVSASTDGRVLWWDCRNLKEPVEECRLTPPPHSTSTASAGSSQGGTEQEEIENTKLLGAISLAWSLEAGPTKFLLGTEQGIVLSLKTRPKRPPEINQWFGWEEGQHCGTVRAVRRHPFFGKYFLSVGDWTAKVWMEEVRTPLITTPNHLAFLTDGQWSPTRPGLFMVTRTDGFLSFWDYYYKQQEVAFQHKVGTSPLTCLSVHPQGEMVAVGDADGRVTVLVLCEGLYVAAPNEKAAVSSMLEREARREKNIEVTKRQTEGKRQEEKPQARPRSAAVQEAVEAARTAFFKSIGKEDEPSQESEKAE
ncbi:dynein intermediate chain, putative [Eimeria necatrix]|uniref:Dynein intermediate chain, putative n=1 Tax=Eimeria necatrix TaxID=51315 RepID=U6N2V1_9EIME|nr:dynein intermediate chain, putative [Eimeria necatrix]CDJ70527.1 dynein intermediate chain, putative [Eimeria necatrix]